MDSSRFPDIPDPEVGVLPDANSQGNPAGAPDVLAALEQAAPLLIETLTFHWGTGQGTRVRHLLWSLYTCSHLINLGDCCSGLDRRLAEALAAAVTARLILGAEVEQALGEILRSSGEFTRFAKEESVTPDLSPVIYPPAPADARTFHQVADALDHLAKHGKKPLAGE